MCFFLQPFLWKKRVTKIDEERALTTTFFYSFFFITLRLHAELHAILWLKKVVGGNCDTNDINPVYLT